VDGGPATGRNKEGEAKQSSGEKDHFSSNDVAEEEGSNFDESEEEKLDFAIASEDDGNDN